MNQTVWSQSAISQTRSSFHFATLMARHQGHIFQMQQKKTFAYVQCLNLFKHKKQLTDVFKGIDWIFVKLGIMKKYSRYK